MEELDIKNTLDRLLRLHASVTPSTTKVARNSTAAALQKEILATLPKSKDALGLFLARLANAAVSRRGPEDKTPRDPMSALRALAEKVILKESGYHDMTLEQCYEIAMGMVEAPPKKAPLQLPQSTAIVHVPRKAAAKAKSEVSVKAQVLISIIGDNALTPKEMMLTALESPYAEVVKKKLSKTSFTRSQIYTTLNKFTKQGILERHAQRKYTVAPEFKHHAYFK